MAVCEQLLKGHPILDSAMRLGKASAGPFSGAASDVQLLGDLIPQKATGAQAGDL